jgi:Ca2+-binding EF-hand superfamily protein
MRFNKIDSNGDGTISRKEAENHLKKDGSNTYLSDADW